MLIIDRLELSFQPGLNVLTGETGAGKSILLDAFSLALGGKADGKLVRKGERSGSVTANFQLPPTHAAFEVLADAGFEAEDGELILRRTLSADGKARGFVNVQPVSAGLMKGLGAALLEVHGQHADRTLTQTAAHRRLVDAYGGLGDAASDVASRWDTLKSCKATLTAHEDALAAAQEEADYLRASVQELEALSPEPGEE